MFIHGFNISFIDVYTRESRIFTEIEKFTFIRNRSETWLKTKIYPPQLKRMPNILLQPRYWNTVKPNSEARVWEKI